MHSLCKARVHPLEIGYVPHEGEAVSLEGKGALFMQG